MKSLDIEQIVERVGDLPAMPAVVSDALAITDSAESDMETVGKVLERDPGLAARILRVSNSPYFGMRQHVGTLKLALVILGVREVRNIILGVSLVDALRDAKSESLLTDRFWQDSFRVASLSKRLGKAFSLGCQGEDFISGLLHGIGKMVLARQVHDKYAPIFNQCADDDELAKRERESFGFTHADVSAALGKRWNLPETICDALALHLPSPERRLADAKDPQLAASIRVAYYAGRNAEQDAGDAVESALTQHEAWEVLAAAGTADAASRKDTLLEIVEEVRGMSPLEFG